jgi:hypothetical protein
VSDSRGKRQLLNASGAGLALKPATFHAIPGFHGSCLLGLLHLEDRGGAVLGGQTV